MDPLLLTSDASDRREKIASFARKSDLQYQCRHCTKILSSNQNRKEHEFTHTGELPYICKIPGCGLRFRQGSVLSSHRRIHNMIEKYSIERACKWVKVNYI